MLNVIKTLFSATFSLTFLYQKRSKHKKQTFRNVKNVTRINNVRKLIREPSPVMDNAAGSIRKGTTYVCRSAAWQFPLIADGVGVFNATLKVSIN